MCCCLGKGAGGTEEPAQCGKYVKGAAQSGPLSPDHLDRDSVEAAMQEAEGYHAGTGTDSQGC